MRFPLSVQHTPVKTGNGRASGLAILLGLGLSLLSGCSTLDYYGQAISGHLDLLDRRQPIDTLLADPETPAALREQLRTVLSIRRFASAELGLPDNASYRSYADLRRRFVVWNVVATPPLSLQPIEWCFLIAGCLQYRGYYAEADARSFAAVLKANGYDVFVGGASAYSTLGWFDDPVLNTMMYHGTGRLAQVIFHELAHQQLFIADDSEFNEAFADTVGIAGARRWLAAEAEPATAARFEQHLARENRLMEMVLISRRQLQQIYGSTLPRAVKVQRKQVILSALRHRYELLRADEWRDFSLYDPWFNHELNNAKLAAVATYRALVPAFMRLLEHLDGDLQRFYRSVAALANCPAPARRRWLEALGPVKGCRAKLAKPAANR